jgi:hypothetical protein
MSDDDSVLSEIGAVFAAATRPARFTPLVADPEFEDHEALLQSRDRQSLSRDDVRIGWDPMNSCSAEGIAYYFPCLAAFALQSPRDPWQWYGPQLLFHLGYEGENNRFLRLCSATQRVAVYNLLQHVAASRQSLIAENSVANDIAECIRIWQAAE